MRNLVSATLFNAQPGLIADVPQASKKAFNTTFQANQGTILKALRSGAKAGQSDMKKILNAPLAITQGIPDPAARRKLVQSLLARKMLLFDGKDAKGVEPSGCGTRRQTSKPSDHSPTGPA